MSQPPGQAEGELGLGPSSLRGGLPRGVQRQSSAVNLAGMTRLGRDAELARMQAELRQLKVGVVGDTSEGRVRAKF